MDHVAIMNKSWRLIPKIISGEKTIESRWYQTKRTPWDKAAAGDTIYFKDAGDPVTAQAGITGVLQFEIHGIADAENIIERYGKEICLLNADPTTWSKLPKYCILLRLTGPQKIAHPFEIDKSGFGTGAAWLTVPDITKIKR